MDKVLRIVSTAGSSVNQYTCHEDYGTMLSNLAIAEAQMYAAGMKTAMPHFIAIIKELERIYGFQFETVNDEHTT